MDDEIEFHNSAEPSTTACPMLPGQLVNILEVPVALSGARERNASIGSTSSDLRTLNPADKYLNPRPVPALPKMMRVTTSPGLIQDSDSTASSPIAESQTSLSRTSSKDNLKISNMHRLPRKASLEAFTRSALTTHKTAGLRQAFRAFRNGRSPSPGTKYNHIIDWTPNGPSPNTSAPQTPETHEEALSYFEQSPSMDKTPASGGLLLRDNADNFIPTTSFLEHRRERSRSRSRSRDPSQLRRSLVVDEDARREMETTLGRNAALDTVVEVASPQTPVGLPGKYEGGQSTVSSTNDGSKIALQLEKRLPTLPNTPSSAYPPSTDNSPLRKITEQLQTLESHFSTSTIDTHSCLNSMIVPDNSHFSEWSAASDLVSPISDSTIDDSVSSPTTTEDDDIDAAFSRIGSHDSGTEAAASTRTRSERGMFSSTSSTTISSAVSTVPSTAHDDFPPINMYGLSSGHTEPTANNRSGFVHYRLPEACNASEVTLKPCGDGNYIPSESQSVGTHVRLREQTQTMRDRRNGLPHSESMQQLIDELSYLSNAIIN